MRTLLFYVKTMLRKYQPGLIWKKSAQKDGKKNHKVVYFGNRQQKNFRV